MKNKKLIFLLILGSIIGTVFAFISLYQHVELVNELKVSAPNALIKEGLLLNNLTTQKVKELLAL